MPWDTSLHQDRFDPLPNEKIMKAVVTAGNGGFEQLQCRMVKHPRLGDNEVLIRVLAAGINNTEINTHIGWYSDSVNQSTSALASSRIQQKKPLQTAAGMRPPLSPSFREPTAVEK